MVLFLMVHKPCLTACRLPATVAFKVVPTDCFGKPFLIFCRAKKIIMWQFVVVCAKVAIKPISVSYNLFHTIVVSFLNLLFMKIPGINTSFSKLSDANFETLARHIAESMAGNGNFPNPNPAIAALTDAVTRYSNALVAAKDLGKNNVAEKNEARDALEVALRLLSLYVMNIANGSVTLLTSSGFPLTKERENVFIEAPDTPTLSNGITPGSLICQVTAVKGGKGYNHQIAFELPTDDTLWMSNMTTTSKFTFTDLKRGKEYWVRVAVTGSRKQIAYSGVASQFAQQIDAYFDDWFGELLVVSGFCTLGVLVAIGC